MGEYARRQAYITTETSENELRGHRTTTSPVRDGSFESVH